MGLLLRLNSKRRKTSNGHQVQYQSTCTSDYPCRHGLWACHSQSPAGGWRFQEQQALFDKMETLAEFESRFCRRVRLRRVTDSVRLPEREQHRSDLLHQHFVRDFPAFHAFSAQTRSQRSCINTGHSLSQYLFAVLLGLGLRASFAQEDGSSSAQAGDHLRTMSPFVALKSLEPPKRPGFKAVVHVEGPCRFSMPRSGERACCTHSWPSSKLQSFSALHFEYFLLLHLA